jgi:hypothetical protein
MAGDVFEHGTDGNTRDWGNNTRKGFTNFTLYTTHSQNLTMSDFIKSRRKLKKNVARIGKMRIT